MGIIAIILAAGKGQRMGKKTPKQFITLYRKPLWYYSVKMFLETFSNIQIIITTLPDGIENIQSKCMKFFPNKYQKIQVISGGEMRFHSVKNALQSIPNEKTNTVFIHDAARCLISSNLLKRLYTEAEKNQSAIPVVPVTDSIRKLENNEYKHLDRNTIFSVQTPQVFESDILLNAFKTEFKNHFTDDASVVEESNYKVHFIPGEISNIKVTYPIDIEIAKWYLKNRKL